jgi:hypothetical protein
MFAIALEHFYYTDRAHSLYIITTGVEIHVIPPLATAYFAIAIAFTGVKTALPSYLPLTIDDCPQSSLLCMSMNT